MEFDSLSNQVIGCAIEVHRNLGPGLLESTYERCLSYELKNASIKYETQKPIPIVYKDQQLEGGYRADIVVDDSLIIELKCVERILPIHEAQLLSYMKLGHFGVGLIINFNVKLLRDGIRRFVL